MTGWEICRIGMGCYTWCQAEWANILSLGLNFTVHQVEFWGDGPQSKKLAILFTCHWQGHSGKVHSIWVPDIQNIHKEIGEDPCGLAGCFSAAEHLQREAKGPGLVILVERRMRTDLNLLTTISRVKLGRWQGQVLLGRTEQWPHVSQTWWNFH